MRLIDADALIEKCGNWYTEEGPAEGFIGSLEQLLNKQPTVDAEPKTGKWIPVSQGVSGGYFECSECEGRALFAEDGVEELSKHCPNCGARMDGEK